MNDFAMNMILFWAQSRVEIWNTAVVVGMALVTWLAWRSARKGEQ